MVCVNFYYDENRYTSYFWKTPQGLLRKQQLVLNEIFVQTEIIRAFQNKEGIDIEWSISKMYNTFPCGGVNFVDGLTPFTLSEI
jgi:hypothetical protein